MKINSTNHNNLFDTFGEEISSLTLPASKSQEQTLIALAEHYQDTTKPGHGFSFDFEGIPELKQPIIDYLVKGFGWKLETPFFIRKPE